VPIEFENEEKMKGSTQTHADNDPSTSKILKVDQKPAVHDIQCVAQNEINESIESSTPAEGYVSPSKYFFFLINYLLRVSTHQF